MNEKRIQDLDRLDGSTKYSYFVEVVSDFEEAWGLFADGWAVCSNDSGEEALPVWPEKELADLCRRDNWAEMTPRSIDLDSFLERWLPGLAADKRLVAVFPSPGKKGVFVSPQQLKIDLEAAIEQLEN